VIVAGYRFGDGMVYVGRDLPAVRETWSRAIEPALIQPHLPIDTSNPDRDGSTMEYWPSYQELSPWARAGYLEWLAGGRRAADAYIGFVFLFFYGIERRVLGDADRSEAARTEVDGLLSEVEELLGVYGNNASFHGYARRFLEAARLLHCPVPLADLEPPAEGGGKWCEVPLTTRLALGACADQGKPIPARWALSWVLDSQSFRMRTAAFRCSQEFQHLFKLRYPEAFRKGGLKIRPNKTRLAANYRPASSSFAYGTIKLTVPNLPDVTILAGPVRKLQELVDKVTDELDAYSRWVGRKDDRDSPAALALLPPELATQMDTPQTKEFLDALRGFLSDNGAGVVPAARLISFWPSSNPAKLTKLEAIALARFLSHRGIGLEPDCRYGGPPLGKAEKAVVFELGNTTQKRSSETVESSDGYRAATLLLHLAVAVAAADGEIARDEERQLEEHLETGLELPPAERHRLRHHLRWLLEEPPGMAGMKRRIEPLDEEQRQTLGRFVIAVAGADGRIDPEEIKILRKIYPLLGLEADVVFSNIHALIAGAGADQGPVTVVSGRSREGHPIPSPKPAKPETEKRLVLDAEKIRATRQASERIAGVLAEIFEDEDPAERVPGPEPQDDGLCIGGLDAPHSTFLRHLAERPSWKRDEIEQLAERFGVMPDGALELINDAAIESCGDPLLEGHEVIEIDQEIAKEMTR